MKRIILVLLASLLVFGATLGITGYYIFTHERKAADAMHMRMVNDFCRDFNSNLMTSEEAVASLLSAFFDCQYDSVRWGDRPRLVIPDNRLPYFTHDIVPKTKDFLRLNPYFHSAVFFVDDSVSLCNLQYGFHRGYAMAIVREDMQEHDLSYDFMHASTYNRIKREKRDYWTLPSPQSRMHGKVVIYYVPIFCQNGQFFGTFSISVLIEEVHKSILKHLPYGTEDSELYIFNTDGHIVASYPEVYEQFGTRQSVMDYFNITVESSCEQGEGAITQYKDERWFVRMGEIPASGWIVASACRVRAVYADARNILWTITLVSLLGILLMSVCCWVIFRRTRADMRRKALVESELTMAAKVQTGMLQPADFHCPQADLHAYLRPAREAGGDLYGYRQVDDKLLFYIGDVSGKGMPAALFVTQIMSLFSDAVRHCTTPEQIVCEINNVLADQNPDMSFCTFWLGLLDGNTLTYCNAGHNPPLILRPDESPQCLPMRANMAMGLVSDFPYQHQTITLRSGDTLVLYTDGVTEAKNRRHEEFGVDRLIHTLTSASESGRMANPIPDILSALSHFVHGYEQSDDITLLTVRRE